MRPFATCHPNKFNKAKGLCQKCYERYLRRQKGIPERVFRAKATCHPDRKMKAKGLCEKCYDRQRVARPRKFCKSDREVMKPNPAVVQIMNNWQKSLDDLGIVRRVLEGIFGPYHPASKQELL